MDNRIKKILFLLLLLLPFNVVALEPTGMHFQKAIVYDMTDDVVRYDLDGDKRASIASLTKIMTTIISIEHIKDFNEKVTYTANMASEVDEEASIAGLEVGESYTYDDLIYASILPSGADATTALAFSLYGSIDNFVNEMNNYAQKLEMNDTHFVNVTGMEIEGHYRSCEDLIKLLKYALSNPKFKNVYTTKRYTLTNGLTVQSTVIAYSAGNDTTRILGSKTGFTYNAGRCISIYFISNNHEYIAVTLGAPSLSSTIHVTDALGLIAFYDNNYAQIKISKKGDVVKEVPVENSNVKMYKVTSKSDVTEYLEVDYDKDKVEVEYVGEEKLNFLDKKGSNIGKVNYYYDGKLLASEDVTLDIVIKPNILKLAVSYWYVVLLALLFILFLAKIIRKKLRRKRHKKAYM